MVNSQVYTICSTFASCTEKLSKPAAAVKRHCEAEDSSDSTVEEPPNKNIYIKLT